MTGGKERLKAKIEEIYNKGMDATPKENTLVVALEVVNEMLERGFDIKMVDLNKSDAINFIIEEDSYCTIPSSSFFRGKRGSATVAAREESDFLSKEDLAKRGKVSKTVMEYLETHNVVNHLPDEKSIVVI